MLPAKSCAKVDAIAEPVEEHSIIMESTANTRSKQWLNKTKVINGGSDSDSNVMIAGTLAEATG